MDNSVKRMLGVQRFTAFPKDLEEARAFIKSKGLNANRIDDATLERIVSKVNGRQSLTPQEVSIIHRVTDLGDTCGCDSDHRIRGIARDGKKIGYSIT